MEKALVVAKTLCELYKKEYEKPMEEIRLQKIMYFAQRESLIKNNCALFDEEFFGWKYGPVLLSVKSECQTNSPFSDISGNVAESTLPILRSVLDRYGALSTWRLSIMTHEEFSWILSRKGLSCHDNGNAHMSLTAMRLDAAREVSNRKNRRIYYSES